MNTENKNPVRIAIGLDSAKWHEKFSDALDAKRAQGHALTHGFVDFERSDWIEAVSLFDVVLWKPGFMGPLVAAQCAAKMHFMDAYLKKRMMPNYATIWHFENKIAQSYLMQNQGIPTPKTLASFDYHDAVSLLQKERFPLVFKEPHGAGSSNVKLVASMREAKSDLARIFSHQLWMESKARAGSGARALSGNAVQRWLWNKIFDRVLRRERLPAVYWQEFIPGNDADLRITAIGDRYAFGFWRKNRPGDFRASGSGLIDYVRPVPEEAVSLCLSINKKLKFDSMAYDILIRGKEFLITEISCGYLDTAIYNTPGHYRVEADGRLSFNTGHVWPQELWVDWMLERMERQPSGEGKVMPWN